MYAQGATTGDASSDLRLDLYVPESVAEARLPLVVAIHGGGFKNGSKDGDIARYARAIAGQGYVVAAINYRLQPTGPRLSPEFEPLAASLGRSGEEQFDPGAVAAAVEDTTAALRYLQALPGVDPSRTALFGLSAGAITALYLSYSLDELQIDRPPVSAVVSNWGGFFANPGDAAAIDGAGSASSSDSYVEGPVYLAHTTGDPVIPFQLASDIVERAQEVDLQYEVFALESAEHGFDLLSVEVAPGVSVLQRQVNWLDSSLFEDRRVDVESICVRR